MKVIIINGPNLNVIGKREEAFYGKESFEKILEKLRSEFEELEIEYFQSNTEGAIVDKLQSIDEEGFRGLVINPAAYSHYSLAILDALYTVGMPKVEVHFSNIYGRGHLREKSVTSAGVDGVIAGLGSDSYRMALQWLTMHQRSKIGFGRR